MSLKEFFYDDLELPENYHSIEIDILDDHNFLRIKETLTRMGLATKARPGEERRTLWQSAHILHKQGKYYIVHFKELFLLDGNHARMGEEDLIRRNMIAELLEKWGLIKLVSKPIEYPNKVYLKIIPYKEKHLWILSKKYTLQSDKKKALAAWDAKINGLDVDTYVF